MFTDVLVAYNDRRPIVIVLVNPYVPSRSRGQMQRNLNLKNKYYTRHTFEQFSRSMESKSYIIAKSN